MRLTIAAATLAIAALVAGPALADHVSGGMVKQNGQCWAGAKGWDGGTYGYWKACAEPAGAPAAKHSKPRHQ
jgi:hypothetical protein